MRLSTYLVGVPVAVIAAVVGVANRQIVTFSLDPFSVSHPSEALSVRMPLFVLVIAALLVGAVLGGIAGRWPRRKRPDPASGGKGGLPMVPGGSKPPGE